MKNIIQTRWKHCMLFCLILTGFSLGAQDLSEVTGAVTDDSNEPLIGVNVRVKGTNMGTATDFDGAFIPVSYTHLRAHETLMNLVCRLLLEKKKTHIK